MKRILSACLGLFAAASLGAYGVSPNQYNNGRAADGQAPQIQQSQPGQLPYAPAPMPVPMNQMGQGGQFQAQAQPQIQAPQQPQDFDAMAIPEWAKAWKHYKWEEAKAAWDAKDSLFIDARAKSEYDQAHIPGAIPMPVGEFDKYFAMYEGKIKHAKHLITYCHGVGCQLSNKVAQKLYNDKKLKNVGSFFGGWPQWQQHNMPVETGGVPKPR
jgi:rhodanese-related sulfurtransferase